MTVVVQLVLLCIPRQRGRFEQLKDDACHGRDSRLKGALQTGAVGGGRRRTGHSPSRTPSFAAAGHTTRRPALPRCRRGNQVVLSGERPRGNVQDMFPVPPSDLQIHSRLMMIDWVSEHHVVLQTSLSLEYDAPRLGSARRISWSV